MSIQFYREMNSETEALFEKKQISQLLYFAPNPATTSVTDVRELFQYVYDSKSLDIKYLSVFVATPSENL